MLGPEDLLRGLARLPQGPALSVELFVLVLLVAASSVESLALMVLGLEAPHRSSLLHWTGAPVTRADLEGALRSPAVCKLLKERRFTSLSLRGTTGSTYCR